MKHHMKIYIGGEPPGPTSNIFRCATLPMRERVLRFLFGELKRLTIIVPGRSVDTVEVKEIDEEGDRNHEQNQTAT